MTLAELIRRAAKKGETALKVWKPDWPDTAYLEVSFNAAGVLAPTARAVLTDGEGNVGAEEMVMMLFAPVAKDYEEWKG